MVDGYLNFDTKVDVSGFEKGMDKVTSKSEDGEKAVRDIGEAADEVNAKINAILNDSTRSMKSKAASIGAILKQQGQDSSTAMTNAWAMIERGTANIGETATTSTKGVNKLITRLKVLAKMYIGLNVVKGLVNLGTQAIELASDLEEVQNVVDTAFGDMAYKCEEFADVAIEQFGMSKLSAKQTASTYMSMAKAMGLSMDSASDMAIETAKLTGDVASFYNISTDLAATKLKSIFTGETETLKDLGVVMTEANLAQYALANGYKTAYKDMSQAEKVALRYNFVMDALSDAQGDFAKTSDSWANQTRILSERWKELLSIMGSGLIRIFTPVIQVINQVMSALINLANTFANTVGKLFGFNKEIKASTKSATAAAGAEADLAEETEAAGEAASGSLASFDKLDVLQKNTSSSSGSGGGGGVDLSFDEIETPKADTKIFDTMSAAIERLRPHVDKLKDSWNNLRKAFEKFYNSAAVQGIIKIIKDMTKAFAEFTLTSSLDALSGFFDTIADNLGMWTDLSDTIQKLSEGDYSGAWDSLKSAFGNLKKQIVDTSDTFDALPDAVKAPFSSTLGSTEDFFALMSVLVETDWAAIWEALKKKVSDGWDSVKQNTSEAVESVKKSVSEKWDDIKDKTTTTWESIKESVSNAATNAKDNVSTAWETVKTATVEVWDSVKDKCTDVFDSIKKFIEETFAPAWNKAWKGVATMFCNVWNGIVDIVEGAVNLIIDAVNWCIDQINKIHVDVPDWVTELTGMTSFGFSIPNLSSVKLGRITPPALASGAVIPPNGEFLAMLGDQRSGNNLEAPESLIRQIVREESGGGDVIINAKGTMGQLIRLLKLEVDRENNRTGKSFARGGAY